MSRTAARDRPEAPERRAPLLPVRNWLPGYDRRLLRGDLAAAVTVTALIVPKNLGYAGIAGIPLQNGLYAAAAGAVIYAIFGTCRQISTGPSSSLAAVAGGAGPAPRRAGGRRGGGHRLRSGGRPGGRARRGDRARHGRAVRADGGPEARPHRATALQSRGHRLSRGRGDRRRHRRVAEADRNRRRGQERLARA